MRKKLKKELTEWGILIVVLLVLFSTNLGTLISSALQRGLLATGLMNPSVNERLEVLADYGFSVVDGQSGLQVPMVQFKGKTVFMNFWATWCPPCIAEMPSINNLYERFRDNADVAFVIISVDKNPAKARDFLTDKDFDLPLYFIEDALPSVYNTHSIPATYVLSPEGKIVVERHGIAKYDNDEFISFIERLSTTASSL